MDPVSAGANFILHPKTTIVSSIKTLSDHLNKSVLHEKYVQKGLSARQMSVLLGVPKSTILDSLKREGIPLREKGSTFERPANPPYGKRHLKGKLADDPREKKIITLIGRLYSKEKLTCTAIARKLSELKINTRRGSTTWHHFVVSSILKKSGKMK